MEKSSFGRQYSAPKIVWNESYILTLV